MFQTSVLASGSKGNSLVVRTADSAIILDAGISVKRIVAALERLSIPLEQIRGVILSHDHSDHSSGVGALSRKLKIPVFITEITYDYVNHRLGNLYDRLRIFNTGESFELGDIVIEPFRSNHDAVDSANFNFYQLNNSNAKLSVATDLGYPTMLSVARMEGSTSLVLESNHDEQMLIDGPYEWHLKQRVKSNLGHLSNKQAVGLITRIHHPGLKNLVLAHLSETNNRPELARSTMQGYLESIRSDVRLLVADPYQETPLIDI
ncbi:MAG: MBL fold metallo-hydrolase [Candidatus Cloacimonetes bacterium HGW-Cloacimonetes-2]|jgi:phosphoribosyl 1,2-cyclic phosphodiesterase|nr:MAG: MBL fold metallo-hydrolase [Candidatus Cloacimonetes bacterium HGW-Cloacimonetes-2]